MSKVNMLTTLLFISCWVTGMALLASDPTVSFKEKPGQVEILIADQPLATYYYQDQKITRPYFAHLRAPGGIQVTRNHPPVEGRDEMDHATLHPGLWLAFGDLSKADSWRNLAHVKHESFVVKPSAGAGSGEFTVRNRYLANDGQATLCYETCRYRFMARPAGYLIVWDSQFQSSAGDFVFGDQEEMGLGVRVATPLSVKQGGQITLSSGERNEKEIRGKSAAWCDYSGTIDGHHLGITLMPHPDNFRPCWYHARDYGFVAANPFGRKALTKGEASDVVVKKGEVFRLSFGVLVHASHIDQPIDIAEAYSDYAKITASQ
jgi:Methane oxygenase PmoA